LANFASRLAPLKPLKAFHQRTETLPLVRDPLGAGFGDARDFFEHLFEGSEGPVALFREVACGEGEVGVLDVPVEEVSTDMQKATKN
jgi:hypothetical protein